MNPVSTICKGCTCRESLYVHITHSIGQKDSPHVQHHRDHQHCTTHLSLEMSQNISYSDINISYRGSPYRRYIDCPLPAAHINIWSRYRPTYCPCIASYAVTPAWIENWDLTERIMKILQTYQLTIYNSRIETNESYSIRIHNRNYSNFGKSLRWTWLTENRKSGAPKKLFARKYFLPNSFFFPLFLLHSWLQQAVFFFFTFFYYFISLLLSAVPFPICNNPNFRRWTRVTCLH